MPRVHDFYNCCTASILFEFGGSSAAMHGDRFQPDEKKLAEDVEAKMRYFQRSGKGIFTAMLTTEQTVAAKVLEALGWTKCMTSNKLNHSNTQLQLWAWAAKAEDKSDVVVVNPFAVKKEPEVVKEVVPTARPEMRMALRSFDTYRVPPVGRWIRIDGSRPCPERIRDRQVSILTTGETVERNAFRRLEFPEAGRSWAWEIPVRRGGSITHVYIHPLA